jgi:hypothetical protein
VCLKAFPIWKSKNAVFEKETARKAKGPWQASSPFQRLPHLASPFGRGVSEERGGKSVSAFTRQDGSETCPTVLPPWQRKISFALR